MAVLLRIILVVVTAVIASLAVPRVAGEEYYLAVRWERSLSSREVLQPGADFPDHSGVFATGRTTLGVFRTDDGEAVYRAARHPFLSKSAELYLNQSPVAGGRWVVTDRRTGERTFHDPRGMPAVYGPLLVQFREDEVHAFNTHLKREITIPQDGDLTVFDARVVTDPDGADRVFLVTGDFFGVLRLLTIDFLDGAYESVEIPLNDHEEDVPVIIYGVALLPEDPPEVLVLYGTDPQVLEFRSFSEHSEPRRYIVPDVNAIRRPPVIRAVDEDFWAVGLNGLLALVSRRTGAFHTIPMDGLVHPAGFLSARITGFAAAAADRSGTVFHMQEALGNEVRSVRWHFPGATPAAVDRGLLVLERDDHFFAVEVRR